MNIIQSFYDNMAACYNQLFDDWQAATHEQAVLLNKIFRSNGCSEVEWKFPGETGFYQPIIIARK